MAYSSILGADHAPALPSGRGSGVLGPSDNSDSGSDTVGTHEAYADSDATGTGERGSVTPGESREGADIMPDHVVRMDRANEEDEDPLASGEGFPADDADGQEMTDLDVNDVDAGESSEDEAGR
ncbi:MAG TPA: hypothetical protein VLI46_03580 [Ramlibacter sp.]|nr:hypothetical protein [Ramlibacter sp.]